MSHGMLAVGSAQHLKVRFFRMHACTRLDILYALSSSLSSLHFVVFDLPASQFLFSNDLHVIFSSDKKEILSLLIHRFLISDARFSSRQIENCSFVFNSKLVLSVRSLTATFRHRFIKIHIATEIYLFAYQCVCCVFECLIGHRLLNWL